MNEIVPWFVKYRLKPSETRQRLLQRDNIRLSFISQREWITFLERKRKSRLKVNRGANTVLRCPKCGQFLRHFYITMDKKILAKAKEDAYVHRLISGYICWFPCSQTYFSSTLNVFS